MAPMPPVAATPPSTARQCMFTCKRDRPEGHRDHPHPQEWANVERGLPRRDLPTRNPARHPALRPGILKALDRIPCTKPDRGEPFHGLQANHCRATDAVPQSLRRGHRRKATRQLDRRNPDPHRPHQPLQRPRHSRDHSRVLTSAGKGEVMPQA